ncbi:MAG: dTMP kinase [Anaerolineae bacterium]|nr:dTMP kinase [Anaerolineae bacterium]
MFITFEGGEGSGKTTQVRLLGERLTQLGYQVMVTREPGGTPLGAKLRALLLDVESQIEPRAELLLYAADRAQHVATLIRPALADGKIVISDRYADSALAYQGYGRGLDLTALRQIMAFATSGLQPDLTFFLDLDPQQGLARRAQAGASNRFEAQTLEFHRRVREGYLALIAAEPERWVRIDADQPLAVVQGTIFAVVEERLQLLQR